jgi:hypothetical protein
MAAGPRRILLGKRSGLSSRQRIYRTPDAIEVEEAEGYDVSRRRVWLDEVVIVTYHQTVGWGFVAAMLACMTIFGFVGLLVMIGDRWTGAAFLAITVLPFALALVLRLVYKLDVITVFGRRTKAELQFWLRKARARQVYQQVARLARERQQRMRAAAPVRRPQTPPPVPRPFVPPPPELPPELPEA